MATKSTGFSVNCLCSSLLKGKTIYNPVIGRTLDITLPPMNVVNYVLLRSDGTLFDSQDDINMLQVTFNKKCKDYYYIVKIVDKTKPLFEVYVQPITSHQLVEKMRKEQSKISKGERKKAIGITLPRYY
jgi:hypothetical protein